MLKHKAIKKLISAAMAAALSLALTLPAFAADSYIEYAGYIFSLTDGAAGIHDYDGEESELFIPETIWDYPVVAIDNAAFFGREDFTDLYLQEGKQLKTIGARAFYGCTGISFAEVPADVETIGPAAFQNCTGLRELVFDGEKLTELPLQLCCGCSALETVRIPSSVTSIGSYAFGECGSLKKVEIPDSVTEIDPNAFTGSDNIVIYASAESYAIAYAREHGLKYVYADMIPASYLSGDADIDGRITVIDVSCIQRTLSGMIVPVFNEKAADVDGAGLDIIDASSIQRYLADFDDPYRIGEIQ